MGTHALLHEDLELALILNVDELLAAIGRVADVQLAQVSDTLSRGILEPSMAVAVGGS